MGFDWNGDGKHDWKDDAFFHNVINNDSSKEQSTENNTSKERWTQNNTSRNRNINPQKHNVSHWQPSQLGFVVAVVAVILIICALFMGYGNIIPSLLGFGFIAFCIANWLDS